MCIRDSLYEDKQVFWFLLAFFCYIDGVYTIIDMATAYGLSLIHISPCGRNFCPGIIWMTSRSPRSLRWMSCRRTATLCSRR